MNFQEVKGLYVEIHDILPIYQQFIMNEDTVNIKTKKISENTDRLNILVENSTRT